MKEYQYETLSQEEETINDAFIDEQKETEEYPKTIKELKKWVQEQGVSRISDFGLYINYNSNKTGHAGLYKGYGEYVIYQNGYDGHKDIIYKGPNEKFAVKQFCILFRKTEEVHKRVYKIYEKKEESKKFKFELQLAKPVLITLGSIAVVGILIAILMAKTL